MKAMILTGILALAAGAAGLMAQAKPPAVKSQKELDAVKALFAEIPIRGHLPVTIPNIAARGAGIEKPGLVPPPSAQPGGTNAQAK